MLYRNDLIIHRQKNHFIDSFPKNQNIKVIIKLKYNKAILITYHGSVGFLTLALKIKRNARLLCSDWLRKCFAWLRKSREAKNSHRCAAVTRSRIVQARQEDESKKKKKIRAKNK